MPAANMTETLQLPALQVPEPVEYGGVWSSNSTPSLRRRRFKMRRTKKIQGEKEQSLEAHRCQGASPLPSAKEFLQLPSIEITPSSDEEMLWSGCSTPSTSPRRKRFLLKKWIRVREKKELSESSSQQSSQQSSHDDDSSRYLSPRFHEESTASNSNRSTPACSPILRKRSRSPTPQNNEGDVMVEKGSDHSFDKSPSTPEQCVQRSCSSQSGRSGGKNSKKSQSWYNVLSPTYKQRNEDFRKLFKQLPDSERLIVDYSCALQRDILLQGRLYLSENWICFYSNIFRWETLLTVRLKDICSMTKEKTARLIPNAIQVCTDTEKHFFTSFGARDRTYMMMFRLWQNALLEKPLCPKELWHFVHQCYGNELGLTSDDEDYVPPDDDFNTMGYCEEIPVEDAEVNDNSSKGSMEVKPDSSPRMHEKSLTNSTLASTGSSEAPLSFDGILAEEELDSPLTKELVITSIGEKIELIPPVNSPSLDFNDNEDIPTELSDSSATHDEGEVQAFYEDLNGRQYMNEVFNFNVDKLFDLLFTDSQFQRNFMDQRRFSEVIFHPWTKEDNGNQTRVILYTITLTNPLAPKTATVTETQTLYKASQESECYVIDAEVLTHDVPYHDYFYTVNRYTLTRVARNKSRLRVSTELRYRKQPWGLVKTFIEKNFWSGLDDYFHHLENELAKTESAYLAELHRQSSKEKVLKAPAVRRRKRPHTHLRVPHLEDTLSPVTTPTDEEVIHRIKHVAGSTQTRHVPEERQSGLHLQSVSKLLLIISCVLVLLVILNMMLFYKLWMLEYTTQTLTAWQGLRLQERVPQSQAEWTQLLESQQKYHDSELQKWREIIKSSVMLLDQMKDSLINLQNGIGSRDYGSKPDEKRNRYH
ncbi:protein Aster-B isoform X4 [Rhinatrema bivittatum]|uniref:protein Aster-B isoform X4 n=1 Tax=Rhinatrema bivittatum TaxID=194408 RepID=UPI00112C8537|nr:protein Aster-B isoform X4 [Rhinatrema bivittatum]